MSEQVIEYKVPDDASGERADKVFAAGVESISRARLQKAFAAGRVTFNGLVIESSCKLSSGGTLRAVLETPDAASGPRAVPIPLSIVHEDPSIIVVNKAAGMVTHPGSGTDESTLVHALLHHTDGHLSSVGAPERPGIVHRLDKDTTGLIVVAKTDPAHYHLVRAFSERMTFKRYSALVLGSPTQSSGSIKERIGRHPVHRTRMAIHSGGREAHTDWSVEKRFGTSAALVHCVIHTGRTHQIRVHLSHLKHPLLADTTYGYKANRLKHIAVPRVMLHAAELEFPHPDTGEKVHFSAPVPNDFNEVMGALSAL